MPYELWYIGCENVPRKSVYNTRYFTLHEMIKFMVDENRKFRSMANKSTSRYFIKKVT